MADSSPAADAMVCFCYRKTLGDLKALQGELGTLEAIQEKTKVGMGCGGCRPLLHHHFGTETKELADFTLKESDATLCVKPGNRVMKAFIASSSLLESRLFSSNGVPLQLGDCDSGMTINLAIYSATGKMIYSREQALVTGETFVFDTMRAGLPRPFYGMVAYTIQRQNYGGGRLNVAWYSGDSVTSTHENHFTGRPDVVLPVPVDQAFLKGPNDLYLAVLNPHSRPSKVVFRLFDFDQGDLYNDLEPPAPEKKSSLFSKKQTSGVKTLEFTRTLGASCTQWIDAVKEFYGPALEAFGGGRVGLRIYSPGYSIETAPVVYFFFHHRKENVWSANHL